MEGKSPHLKRGGLTGGSISPVSYTHLDVYKRQDILRLEKEFGVKDIDLVIEFTKDCITFYGDFLDMITTEIDGRIDANRKIRNELDNLQYSARGIYADVGAALEKYTLQQLFDYYIDEVMNGHSIPIRDYLETQIINDEINKIKKY